MMRARLLVRAAGALLIFPIVAGCSWLNDDEGIFVNKSEKEGHNFESEEEFLDSQFVALIFESGLRNDKKFIY